MKKLTLIALAILLAGCGENNAVRTGEPFSEEWYELQPIIIIVSGSPEESSIPNIQDGRWTMAAVHMNGDSDRIYGTAYRNKDGLLFFSDMCTAGHELQHIMHYEYPEQWGNPDEDY